MVISSIFYCLNYLLTFPRVDAKPCHIKTYKVFVYGTLKTGEPNHAILKNPNNGVATFISEAKTRKKFPMIIATKYHMPFLLFLPGRGCIIEGEVYEVNVPMLGRLDKLVNPSLYTRENIDIGVKLPNGSTETVPCTAYFLNSSLLTDHLLEHRNIGKYSSKGKHGLTYISNSDASPSDLEDPILKY